MDMQKYFFTEKENLLEKIENLIYDDNYKEYSDYLENIYNLIDEEEAVKSLNGSVFLKNMTTSKLVWGLKTSELPDSLRLAVLDVIEFVAEFEEREA